MKQLNLFSEPEVESTPSKVMETCSIVRTWLVDHYGEGVNLAGHCIEASDLIVKILTLLDYTTVETVEGWCRYDDTHYCEYPYDAHTWVELTDGGELPWYIDVTAEQFNYGMDPEFKFPPIIVRRGLPHGMSYVLPEDREES